MMLIPSLGLAALSCDEAIPIPGPRLGEAEEDLKGDGRTAAR
jgi:hypothetical protein